MKLTAQHVYDVTLLITQIINERRPMPTKGAYRIARLHAKLLPEFNTINAQRESMIKAYDTHHKILVGEDLVDGPEFVVPPDKLDEFTVAWKEIGETEIDINVEPIPVADLDIAGASNITAGEFITLGDLVKE